MTCRESSRPDGVRGPQEQTCERQPDSKPAPVSVQDPKPISGKRAHVLRVFLERGDKGMNCFQAVELARDFVLRTTVSEIRKFHGIEFHKEPESFTNPGGTVTTCTRYRLTLEGAQRARDLLSEAPRPQAKPDPEAQARWERAVRAQERERQDRAQREPV
jgi:hypothetical protein